MYVGPQWSQKFSNTHETYTIVKYLNSKSLHNRLRYGTSVALSCTVLWLVTIPCSVCNTRPPAQHPPRRTIYGYWRLHLFLTHTLKPNALSRKTLRSYFSIPNHVTPRSLAPRCKPGTGKLSTRYLPHTIIICSQSRPNTTSFTPSRPRGNICWKALVIQINFDYLDTLPGTRLYLPHLTNSAYFVL